jgi:hypothetical protein
MLSMEDSERHVAGDLGTHDANPSNGLVLPLGFFEKAWREMIDMPLDDRVLTALERNPYLVRRNLRFETSDGRVTLRGVVNTYFQKQMAQESLRNVDGVAEIANELEVCWSWAGKDAFGPPSLRLRAALLGASSAGERTATSAAPAQPWHTGYGGALSRLPWAPASHDGRLTIFIGPQAII